MDLRRALKDEKVPAETVLLGRVPVVNDAREKENFEEFKRTGGLQSMTDRLTSLNLQFL